MNTPDDKLVFRNFEACVRVDGKPLTVYAPEYDEETKTATGWIASKPGAEYSIAWRRTKDVKSDVAGYVLFDGTKKMQSGGLTFRTDELAKWCQKSGVSVSRTAIRPYTFAQLQTTDDPELLREHATAPQPGRVELKLKRVIAGGIIHEKYNRGDLTKAGVVHERTKKLGCHVTKFGEQRTVQKNNVYQCNNYSRYDGDSYVNFVFQYRAPEILQAMDIMPPKGKKRPRDESEELEDDDGSDKEDEDEEGSDVERDEAEIAALQAALQARMNALAAKKKVKREDVEADITFKRRKVKQEEALQVEFFGNPGEVIDLTSD